MSKFATTWTKPIILIEGGRFTEPLEFIKEDGTAASLEGVTIRLRVGTSLNASALLEATSETGGAIAIANPANGKAEIDFSIAVLDPGIYLIEIMLLADDIPFAYSRGPAEVIKTLPGVQ